MPKTYILRNIPDDLWQKVKVQAAIEGKPIRVVLLEFLARYSAAIAGRA